MNLEEFSGISKLLRQQCRHLGKVRCCKSDLALVAARKNATASSSRIPLRTKNTASNVIYFNRRSMMLDWILCDVSAVLVFSTWQMSSMLAYAFLMGSGGGGRLRKLRDCSPMVAISNEKTERLRMPHSQTINWLRINPLLPPSPGIRLTRLIKNGIASASRQAHKSAATV